MVTICDMGATADQKMFPQRSAYSFAGGIMALECMECFWKPPESGAYSFKVPRDRLNGSSCRKVLTIGVFARSDGQFVRQ